MLGPSGSGKSVLLKLLIGLLDAGRGRHPRRRHRRRRRSDERALRPVRRKVAMLFQGAALFDSMTVGENVAYGLREHADWDAGRDRARASPSAWSGSGCPGIEAMRRPISRAA